VEKRVDLDSVLRFLKDYYRGPQAERVGQAFVNHFQRHLPSAETYWLFYEEDPGRALKAIFTEFSR